MKLFCPGHPGLLQPQNQVIAFIIKIMNVPLRLIMVFINAANVCSERIPVMEWEQDTAKRQVDNRGILFKFPYCVRLPADLYVNCLVFSFHFDLIFCATTALEHVSGHPKWHRKFIHQCNIATTLKLVFEGYLSNFHLSFGLNILQFQ